MAGTKFPVKLFYDIISPYSWLAFESLCKYRGSWTKMDLILKPCSIFLLFKESGNPPPLFNPLKSAYIAKDCSRASKIFNVPLKFPSNFADLAVKKGSLKAMRFIMAIDELTNGQSTEAISRHLWRAVFTNEPGKDITDVKVWLEAGENAQIDRATLDKAIEQSNSEVIINKLVEQTKEAVKHGAFGLPTMIVESPDESKMLFGSDRIELLAYLIGEKYQGPCPVSKSNL